MIRDTYKTMAFLLLGGLLVYGLLASMYGYSFSQGPNNRNVSVDTRVNITQSFPVILNVSIEDGITNITLNAGTFRTVGCNVSARDYNGGATIVTANATFYHNTVDVFDSNDNNTHYTNTSCAVTGTNGYFRNFSCTFPVQYYADIGQWYCNVSVYDDYNFTDNDTDDVNIDGLLALNVTPLIDYGDMAVGDTSSAEEANVTNLGNLDINISVRGYGSVGGDGLSFVCQIGDISIEYEKYNIIGGVNPLLYTDLSSNPTQVPDLTIPQQTNDSQQEINTTYWLLVVPPNPFGLCNGTVVFQAESST